MCFLLKIPIHLRFYYEENFNIYVFKSTSKKVSLKKSNPFSLWHLPQNRFRNWNEGKENPRWGQMAGEADGFRFPSSSASSLKRIFMLNVRVCFLAAIGFPCFHIVCATQVRNWHHWSASDWIWKPFGTAPHNKLNRIDGIRSGFLFAKHFNWFICADFIFGMTDVRANGYNRLWQLGFLYACNEIS